MRNILLFPNLDKENGLLCTQQAAKTLRKYGGVPMLDSGFREMMADEDCVYAPFNRLLGQCDILMPIGGDGTIMRAARHAVTSGKPILAVNAGRVGFLTQVELHELENLRLLLEGKYTIHNRMMLEAELQQGGKRRRYSGLNDVVVSRDAVNQIVDIEVCQDGMLVTRQRADGLIFATPTGATAYSLSAGGPIVDPNMRLLLLSTICPHATWGRSMVLSTNWEYSVVDRSAHNPKGLTVVVDGRRIGSIQGEQELLVRKSTAEVQLIDLGLRSFYQNVNDKLSWER